MAGFLVAVVIALMLHASSTLGNPVPVKRWHLPCGRAVPTEGRNVSLVLEKLKTLARDGAGIANNLQSSVSSRIGNYDMESLLMDMHLDNVPTKTHEDIDTDVAKPKAEVLEKEYAALSRYAIFYEQVRSDEFANVNALTSRHDDMLNNLYEMLCEMSYGLNYLSSPVSSFESETIMAESVRTITNDSERNFRDFILIKDSKVYTLKLQLQFARMLQ